MEIREFLRRRRHKKLISNIRLGMLSLGVDLSHLSDEEIERRLGEAARRMASAGIPANDLARGLQNLARAIQPDSV